MINDCNKRDYVLCHWALRTVGESSAIVEGVLPSGVTWRSSVITSRFSNRRVGTASGSQYVLDGVMDLKKAFSLGTSRGIMDLFVEGFPNNWREALSHDAQERKLGHKKETEGDAKMSKKVCKEYPKQVKKGKAKIGDTMVRKSSIKENACDEKGNAKTRGGKETPAVRPRRSRKAPAFFSPELEEQRPQWGAPVLSPRRSRKSPSFFSPELEEQRPQWAKRQKMMDDSNTKNQLVVKSKKNVSESKPASRRKEGMDEIQVDSKMKKNMNVCESRSTARKKEVFSDSDAENQLDSSKKNTNKKGVSENMSAVRKKEVKSDSDAEIQVNSSKKTKNESENRSTFKKEEEIDDYDAESQVGSKKKNMEWTAVERRSLRRGHSLADPHSRHFWNEVAKNVGTKSAQECHNEWFLIFENTGKTRKPTKQPEMQKPAGRNTARFRQQLRKKWNALEEFHHDDVLESNTFKDCDKTAAFDFDTTITTPFCKNTNIDEEQEDLLVNRDKVDVYIAGFEKNRSKSHK